MRFNIRGPQTQGLRIASNGLHRLTPEKEPDISQQLMRLRIVGIELQGAHIRLHSVIGGRWSATRKDLPKNAMDDGVIGLEPVCLLHRTIRIFHTASVYRA